MELKEKNNLWLFLWRFNQGNYESRPNGLCSLFWGGLLGGLLFLLSAVWTLPAWGIAKLRGKDYFAGDSFDKGPMGVLNTLYTTLVFSNWIAGTLFLYEEFGFNKNISSVFGIFLIPLFILVVVSIGIVISYFYDFIKKSKSKNENISILTEGVSSVWNKVCPRIEWKNK